MHATPGQLEAAAVTFFATCFAVDAFTAFPTVQDATNALSFTSFACIIVLGTKGLHSGEANQIASFSSLLCELQLGKKCAAEKGTLLFKMKSTEIFLYRLFFSSALSFSAWFSGHAASSYGRLCEAIVCFSLLISIMVCIKQTPPEGGGIGLATAFIATIVAISARIARHSSGHCSDMIDMQEVVLDPAQEKAQMSVVCDTRVVGVGTFVGSFGVVISSVLLLKTNVSKTPLNAACYLSTLAAVMYVVGVALLVMGAEVWSELDIFYDTGQTSSNAYEERRIAQVGRPAALCIYASAAAAAAAAYVAYKQSQGHTRLFSTSEELVFFVCDISFTFSLAGLLLSIFLTIYIRNFDKVTDHLRFGVAATMALCSSASSSILPWKSKSDKNVAVSAFTFSSITLALLSLLIYWIASDSGGRQLWIPLLGAEVTLFVATISWCAMPLLQWPDDQENTRCCRNAILRLSASALSLLILLDLFISWDVAVCEEDDCGEVSYLGRYITGALHASDLAFFTNHCLIWSNGWFVLTTLYWITLCVVDSEENATRQIYHLELFVASTTTGLFFCAAALFPADCGSARDVDKEHLLEYLVRFSTHHFTQVFPSVLWWTLSTCTAEGQSGPTPQEEAWFKVPCLPIVMTTSRFSWLLGVVCPLFTWSLTLATQNDSIPSDYGCISVHSLMTMLLCGVAPWVGAGFLFGVWGGKHT